MFFLLIPPVFSAHTTFLDCHVHLYAHVVLIVVVFVLSTICTVCALTANNAAAIRALSSSAAHNAGIVSIPLLLALLSTSTVDD
jgi:hypothetical protein